MIEMVNCKRYFSELVSEKNILRDKAPANRCESRAAMDEFEFVEAKDGEDKDGAGSVFDGNLTDDDDGIDQD